MCLVFVLLYPIHKKRRFKLLRPLQTPPRVRERGIKSNQLNSIFSVAVALLLLEEGSGNSAIFSGRDRVDLCKPSPSHIVFLTFSNFYMHKRSPNLNLIQKHLLYTLLANKVLIFETLASPYGGGDGLVRHCERKSNHVTSCPEWLRAPRLNPLRFSPPSCLR